MDISTHGVVAIIRNEGGKYLLLEDCRDQMKGYWAPPHGRCESTDINEESGVIREVFEETGLNVHPVKKLLTQEADTKVKTVSFWLVDLVGGEMNIDESESSAYGWFSIESASTMKLYPGTEIFIDKVLSGEIDID